MEEDDEEEETLSFKLSLLILFLGGRGGGTWL